MDKVYEFWCNAEYKHEPLFFFFFERGKINLKNKNEYRFKIRRLFRVNEGYSR